MPAFNADEAVQKLDWSFKPFVDAEGVVPEPSTDRVGAFFDDLRIALDRPEGETPKSVVAFMEQEAADQALFSDEKVLAAYAALCGDSPNADQLRALPHRQRQAFFGWITGQITNPT